MRWKFFAWAAALLTVLAVFLYRGWELACGRREPVNVYTALGAGLATLFFALHAPSPLFSLLQEWFPTDPAWRWVTYAPYSLILWSTYCAFRIAQIGNGLPERHGRWAFGAALVVQASVLLSIPYLVLETPPSITRAARQGNLAALVFIGALFVFATVCAGYMARTFLWLSQRGSSRPLRLGQGIAAAGLVVLLLAAGEEVAYLAGLVSRSWHSRAILGLVALGAVLVGAGTFIFSRPAHVLWAYIQLRPLGQTVARVWPEVCLQDPGWYAWWTVLDVRGAEQRLLRIVGEWLDLRRLLMMYVPPEMVPNGQEADLDAEAAYLARGLQRETLCLRREDEEEAERLFSFSGGQGEAQAALLRVWPRVRGLTGVEI
ncbi:MAG: hypothetical protein JXA37_02560 [Chloroflexia bacterium]|nr:hypothetical protein [Chloroflexia bacterium]